MQDGRPRVAVVIPAFNEEHSILRVLKEVRNLAERWPCWEFRAFIVNDGSTDRTEMLLNETMDEHSAQVIHLPLNLGIGRAVQAGFRMALRWGSDVTLQLDGVGQHPTDRIPDLVRPILEGQAEVVVGSRYVKGAGGNVSTRLRQLGTWFFSRLLRMLVGTRVEDVTSGFRAFSYEATDFLARHYSDDYPEVQAYVPLAKKRFLIREVGVKMSPRQSGRSSITMIWSAYYVLKVVFATLIDTMRPLPPIRSRRSRRKIIEGRLE
jgi:glycosyltransferase involved in cell wall biosynthesis